MDTRLTEVKKTAAYIQAITSFQPDIGIVLGSGLGGLVNEINIEHSLDYAQIEGFPVSTVEGHQGRLIFGTLSGSKVVVMQGRFHFYEGYGMDKVAFPIRVMKFLGIKRLLLSNASGGMNPKFKVGDLMIIDDHINLFPTNPLIGKNIDELGPRFPDMSCPYDPSMITMAKSIADSHQFPTHIGVYAGLTGPCFETRAEYRYIRSIGADAVGMSTVPEVIVARHMGIPCFGISIITDLGGMDDVQTVSHEEVLKVAKESEKKMTVIIKELIQSIAL